jgi:hypothetical protein
MRECANTIGLALHISLQSVRRFTTASEVVLDGSTFMFSIKKIMTRLTAAGTLALGFTAQVGALANAFPEKPLVAPHIHVERPSMFQPWPGGEVPIGEYNPTFFRRHRLGTMALTPNIRAHLDAVEDTVHFPSYFELIHVRTGKVLKKFPVLAISDAEWYFNGNGSVYLNQRHLSLCGPRSTRKFAVTERAVVEVLQPILYIDEETQVMENTPLYESPSSTTVVATVAAETKVTVVGVRAGPATEETPPLLLKTPLGLTGWHRRDIARGQSSLLIYLCN